MPDCPRIIPPAADGRDVVRSFVILELVFLAGFCLLLGFGYAKLAWATLLIPFQLLAWAAFSGSGFGVLAVFAGLIPLAGAEMMPHSYQQYVLLPGTLGILALLLCSRNLLPGTPLRPLPRVPQRGLLVAFSAWTVLSAANATLHGWSRPAVLENTLLVFEVMLLVYFAAAIPRSLSDVRSLILLTASSMAVVAISIPMLPLVVGGIGGKVVTTPFGETNLNIVACSLTTVAALALGLSTGARRVAERLLAAAVVLLCVVALVVTRSRGAWLGLGVAFLYLLARTRSAGLLCIGAGAGIVLVLSDLLRTMVAARAAATSVYDPAMHGRFMLWYFAWRVAKANWLFGVGMENFRYVKHFYGYPVPFQLARPFNAHSLYMELLADVGVVGTALFLWLGGSAIHSSWRAARSDAARDVGLGLSAGLIACSVHGLVESVMFNPGVFALLGLLVGLSVSLGRLVSIPATTTAIRSA